MRVLSRGGGGCLTGVKWKKEGEAARLSEENLSSRSSR